jgi:hypothetical protein
MGIRLAVAGLAIVSATATAQLTGSFYLKKPTFTRGEPIFLYLAFVNKGPDTAELVTSDPDQPLCSGISITVSNDSIAFCRGSRDSMCSLNGQFRTRQLLSGQTFTMRVLLNFNHDIDATGDYWVDAKYHGAPIKYNDGIPTAIGGAQARLAFRIDRGSIPPTAWKPWLEQLQSPELEDRQEAAKTLASVAPPSLEETLLGFANSAEFRKYSPMAFYRLNTPRSIEAMAPYMEGPVTNEQSEAARYLAKTNDQRWYPLLRDSVYRTDAAELGGEKMLPVLVALLNSPDRITRMNAVMAMGYTRSRAAIPILLDLAKDPDVDVTDRAVYSLRQLTHRTSYQPVQPRDVPAGYIKWSRWWEREGATAPIYQDPEWCGEALPLP